MKIYIGHSRQYNFKNELYAPLRKSKLGQHELILPHEFSDQSFDSKSVIPTCDLVVAEVSYPSTGLGIELGWANCFKVPILCIHNKGTSISGSLKALTKNYVEYENPNDMVSKLQLFLAHFEN
ncbi:MAG: hypothetical protein ABIG95_05550 [Candidatus Woesearchaeota archaeon]